MTLRKQEDLERETARLELLKKEALRVPALEGEIAAARTELEKLKILLPKEAALKSQEALLEKAVAALKIHDEKISATEALLKERDEKISALRAETEKMQDMNNELNSVITAMSGERELLSALERYEAALKRKNTAEQELEKLKAAETGLHKSLEINTKQEDDLKNKKDSSMAASLAAMLQPGVPCPVCGSMEHPEPAI